MLTDTIRKDMTAAVRSGNEIIKTLTRTLLGEISTFKSRNLDKIADQDVCRIVKKMAVGNSETMTMMEECGRDAEPRYTVLATENAYLEGLLPKSLTIHEIKDKLRGVNEITTLISEGQAIGVAMKTLRGTPVQNEDVVTAVKEMRS